MAGLKIDSDKCVGCGLCVRSCAAGALFIANDKAAVDDKCVLCGICTDSCPLEALSIEKEHTEDIDLSLYNGIWVFAEQRMGRVLPVAFELLGKGRELAKIKGRPLSAVLCGKNAASEAQRLIACGADRVLICNDESLDDNLEERYTDLFEMLVNAHKPDILLFGATGFGRSLAPRVAARMRTGLTADCTILEIDQETGLLRQTRPAFGGNLMASIICPYHRPQMATVRPGIMTAREPDDSRKGDIIAFPAPKSATANVELLESVLTPAAKTIADAEIIVSAGRGIGSQKNLGLVRELASLLGGSFGVSRPLVDTGWSEYKHQIGQTGSTVAPKLLIACGISGAIQHLAGINNAKTIIAINSDPDAPIFSIAHYKVVGDCVEILKELIAILSLYYS